MDVGRRPVRSLSMVRGTGPPATGGSAAGGWASP